LDMAHGTYNLSFMVVFAEKNNTKVKYCIIRQRLSPGPQRFFDNDKVITNQFEILLRWNRQLFCVKRLVNESYRPLAVIINSSIVRLNQMLACCRPSRDSCRSQLLQQCRRQGYERQIRISASRCL